MTMRYYHDAKGSLPSISNSESNAVIKRLKAALVDGYGDKPAAGWELLYDNTENQDGTGYRLTVRSKDINGDRMTYHFSEVVNGVDVQMAEDWDVTNKNVVGSTISGKWQKQKDKINRDDQLNTGSIGIIADSKSCWVSSNYCFHFFGSFDCMNAMQPKDVLMAGTHYSYLDGYENLLPLRFVGESVNRTMKDNLMGEYCVDSPAYNSVWFPSNSVPILLRGGDIPYIQKIKMWHKPKSRPSGETWYYAGHIPALVFSFSKITSGDKVMIDGKEKTLIQFEAYGANNQVFAVDEA